MKTIPLTQGKVALVDDDLYPYLAMNTWCLDEKFISFLTKEEAAKAYDEAATHFGEFAKTNKMLGLIS